MTRHLVMGAAVVAALATAPVLTPTAATAASQPLMLFVANYDNSNVVGYPLGGPYGSPRVTLSTDINQPQGLAFDSSGDLWVANASTLVEFRKSQLTKASPTAGIVIATGATLAGLAFDSSGDLWVDGYGAEAVIEYAKSQLTKPVPTPAVYILGSELSSPFGLAFDSSGDLWVGNEGNGQVLEYTKNQLKKSGSPAPKLDISGGSHVQEVVFDSSGNLWTTTGKANSVIEYKKSQLTKPPASPAVSNNSTRLSWPAGLAFDASGNLWVANYSGETVVEFTKVQLRTTGSPAPRQTIEDGGGPVAVAIGP